MTPGGEVRRAISARERETTVPTTLRPTPASPAPAEVFDLVREVLARLPVLDFLSAPVLDRPIAVLALRPAEARRRLSDEVPTKDDDVEDEDNEDDDDWDDDDDDDDWDEDEDDEDDDWDEDDEDDDWDEDEDDEDDDEDDWEEDDDEDDDDDGEEEEPEAAPVAPAPARRRR